MRPLRLSITAFGPFPGTEEIDFTQFSNQNIFLITGPTGGGKTSVFDAVCFALYGEASGGRRETEGFKSDFAPDTATCSVTLRFSIRGREFTVTRTPRQWRQNRKGENVLIPKSGAHPAGGGAGHRCHRGKRAYPSYHGAGRRAV